jgi:uncharacterized membrane protein YkvA (DUF1232 family)
MDFHWWMLLPLIPLTMLALLVFQVFRMRRRAKPFLALAPGERLRFARLVISEGSLPLLPRALVALAAAYLALPIDLIPDFIPVIGHADDFLVVTLATAVITRTLDRTEFEAFLERARDPAVNVKQTGAHPSAKSSPLV